MEINVRSQSDVQLIQLRGPLRLGEAVDELKRTVEQMLADGKTRIVLDLSEVPTMDSSGIGAIVKLHTAAKLRGGSVKLVNPADFVIKTLRLVAVLNLFEIYSDDSEAVLSFAA